MNADSRLSMVLHALLHMAASGRAMPSAELARCLHTNPVVVRRTMAGLREAGLVDSRKGPGGGWSLARALSDITLKDVWAALDEPSLIAMGLRTAGEGCLVRAAVHGALRGAFDDAEALLLTRFEALTLAEVGAPFLEWAHTSGQHSHPH